MKKVATYYSITLLGGLLLLAFAGFIACTSNKKRPSFESPDGDIDVEFMLTPDQQPYYAITYKDSTVIDSSGLGLIRDGIDFSSGMRLESISGPKTISDSYSLLHGKQQEINYTATEKTFHLRHLSGQELDITFHISNDGVAFRYHFPVQSENLHHISEEKTFFTFPEDTRAWLEPLANVNTGYAQTNPSYEEHYKQNIAVGTPAPDSAGWAYPALFNTGNAWVLISESNITGDYPATRLQQFAPEGNYQIGFPQQGEQYSRRALDPQSKLPWSTPWRIVAIGDLATITESTLATDLAAPAKVEDRSWIQPGRAAWSWAKLKDQSIYYETQKQFIDYAADMGWEYVLVDVNWDQNIGYDRMAELSEYAQNKGLGLLLWYNSSGSWNTTEYTPKSELLTHKAREEEFSRLEKMGIKGIKVDFFAGDGQSMMQYYLDIFKDAADHHLLVNTHGATIPRGWQRTWPNLMTMESVKGFEYITFEQGNADRAANHNAMLPFTRNVFGPMDYTPMSLTELNNVTRKTTSAHELALPVLFTSGIQHYAETPRGMGNVADDVNSFVKQIPVQWDEIKFLEGFPGKEVVIARRSGDRWFIAGINGEDRSKKFTLDLSFVPAKAKGTMIGDGDSKFEFSRQDLSPSDAQTVSMQGNGGFVILFEGGDTESQN